MLAPVLMKGTLCFLSLAMVPAQSLDGTCLDDSCIETMVLLQTGLTKAAGTSDTQLLADTGANKTRDGGPHSGASFGKDDCKCIGSSFVTESDRQWQRQILQTPLAPGHDSVRYPLDTGKTCQAWDKDRHPDCKLHHPPGWCHQEWCYVDPCACSVATPAKKTLTALQWQGKPAFWSYSTCGSKDEFSKELDKLPEYHPELDGSLCLGAEETKGSTKEDVKEEAVVETPLAIEEDIWAEVSSHNGSSGASTGDFGAEGCKCIGVDLDGEYTLGVPGHNATYPTDTGTSCQAWERGRNPMCKEEDAPSWCHEAWCYVDPCNCNLEVRPQKIKTEVKWRGRPAYWSYATCGYNEKLRDDEFEDDCPNNLAKDSCVAGPVQHCIWDEDQHCIGKHKKELQVLCTPEAEDVFPEDIYGKKSCRCVGFFPKNGNATISIEGQDVPYPASVGGKCADWDHGRHPSCKAANPPAWCNQKWCYVDPCDCKLDDAPQWTSSKATYQGNPVYWSYGTCGGKDKTHNPNLNHSKRFPPDRKSVV